MACAVAAAAAWPRGRAVPRLLLLLLLLPAVVRPQGMAAVVAFSLDLDGQLLVLQTNASLSVPVNGAAALQVMPGRVALTDAAGVQRVALQESTLLVLGGAPRFQNTLVLAARDLARLGLDPDVATSTGDSFLSLAPSWLSAPNGGPAAVDGLQATAVVPDRRGPRLLEASLAHATVPSAPSPAALLLRFSEAVDVAAVAAGYATGGICLAASPGGACLANLTAPLAATAADPEALSVGVAVPALDYDALLAGLAPLQRTPGAGAALELRLGLASTGIVDLAGNPVDADPASAVPVVTRGLDLVAPELTGFEFDFAQGLVRIFATEELRGGSANVSRLMLEFDGQPGMVFNRDTTLVGVEQDDILVSLTPLAAATAQRLLTVTGFGGATLSSDLGFARDLAGNPTLAVSRLPLQRVVASGSPAQVVAFDLDLDRRLLHLNFSQPVAVLLPARLSLVSGRRACSVDEGPSSSAAAPVAGSCRPLSSLSLSATETFVLLTRSGLGATLGLAPEDVQRLALDGVLANSGVSTFLSHPADAGLDLNGADLAPLPVAMALQVRLFVPDSTPPTLVSVQFQGLQRPFQLVIEASEVVDPAAFRPTLVSLVLGPGSPPFRLGASSGALERVGNSTRYTVLLAQADADALLQAVEGSSVTGTAVQFDAGAVRDPAGNPSAAVLVPAVFGGIDTSVPVLQAFALDLTANELTLTFGEDVILGSLDLARLTLANAASNPTARRTLGGPSVVATVDGEGGPVQGQGAPSRTVVVSLPSADVAELLFDDGLAMNRRSTFLQMEAGAVRDAAGNPSRAVLPPVIASSYTRDRRAPRLVAFDLDAADELLILEFDEPVRPETLDLEALVFQAVPDADAAGSSSPRLAVPLSAQITSTANRQTRIGIALPFSVFQAFRTDLFPLGTRADATFLTVRAGAIEDLRGNGLAEVGAADALPARAFSRETTAEGGANDGLGRDQILVIAAAVLGVVLLTTALLVWRLRRPRPAAASQPVSHKAATRNFPVVPPRERPRESQRRPDVRSRASLDPEFLEITTALADDSPAGTGLDHGFGDCSSVSDDGVGGAAAGTARHDHVLHLETPQFPRQAKTCCGYEAIDSAELSFAGGRVLEVLRPAERPGWVHCRNGRGELGIVLADLLEDLDPVPLTPGAPNGISTSV